MKGAKRDKKLKSRGAGFKALTELNLEQVLFIIRSYIRQG